MAIKIKGKLPLKICSVLFVLYGAASLVALLLCLIDRKIRGGIRPFRLL